MSEPVVHPTLREARIEDVRRGVFDEVDGALTALDRTLKRAIGAGLDLAYAAGVRDGFAQGVAAEVAARQAVTVEMAFGPTEEQKP